MSTGPQRIGKYELRERMASSSTTEVWKALDSQSQRHLVIKLLHPNLQAIPHFVSQFENEMRMIASLHHPNIVQIHDFQIINSSPSDGTVASIVMDYVEGPTLADYIRTTSRSGKFPSALNIVHLFTSISIAIDYAHQHGVIHRNLKPTNILLDKRRTAGSPMGGPMLTDFGIVNLLKTSRSQDSGSWHDTQLYTSPEQAQGYVGNERSDLYALGVILYEICTGIPPFRGESGSAILMEHINASPTPPSLINPEILPQLSVVILRSIAKDPAARFPNASTMTAALADAFNVPIPENLDLSTYSADAMSEPTYYKPRQSSLLPNVSSPSLPIIRTSTPPPVTLSMPKTTDGGVVSTPNSSDATLPVRSHSLSASPPARPRKRRRLLIASLLLLLLLLIGSGIASFLLLSHQNPASQIIGHAYFVSSGLLRADNTQAMDDELLINLHNLPNPAAGKSYYAWLLGDNNQDHATSIFLGTLPTKQGIANITYHGDPQHTDLLATTSRFLITEENTSSTPPASPSQDQHTWRYYAALSQTPNPRDTANHLSMLAILRHLLVEDPTTTSTDVTGGLNTGLFKNTGRILEWAGSARDYWGSSGNSLTLMRYHFIRILDYLDGPSVQADVPPGTPMPISSSLALGYKSLSQLSSNASYLDMIHTYVTDLIQAPGATVEVRQLAGQITTAISNVKTWLEQVHQDVKQLFSLSDAQLQLLPTQSLLDDMQTQAFDAFAGRLDPSTNRVQDGVTQIHFDIAQLATFDITPFTSA